MSSKTMAVDEYAFIAQKLKEIEAAKLEALNTPSLPDPEPVKTWLYGGGLDADYVG